MQTQQLGIPVNRGENVGVPLLGLLMLLGAVASFEDHRTQAEALRPFINAPPMP
jgi:hypothetical protein